MKTYSLSQLSRLWMTFLIASPLTFLLGGLFVSGRFLGWIVIPAALVLSLILVYGAHSLGSAHPGESWEQYGAAIVGKWIHQLFILIIAMYCLSLAAICTTKYTVLMGSMYLPNTPDTLILAICIFCILLVARSGIRTLVFMSDGFFLLVFGASILMLPFMAVSAKMEMSRALVTHWDSVTFLKSTLYVGAWFSEIFLTLLLFPYFPAHGKRMRYLTLAVAGSGLLLLAYWFVILFVFGPDLAAHLRFPLIEVIRLISLGDIMENLDPVAISIWSSSLLIKGSLLLFLAARLVSQQLQLTTHRPLTLGLAPFIFAGSYLLLQHPEILDRMLLTMSTALIVLGMAMIPYLYLAIYKIRHRKPSPSSDPT
ncbi:GerAB/ArcD/ProY family transporter [Paenibacillus filicis]|uniref:GerAB/ArcD/ProY family transporter n=1 Tax=Paenibacillus filicis TaxID=669464 RepID=A0ABU9DCH0_9BACL